METKTRLHPLLTVAAVSLTVLSAVGVAALTGVLPHSRGSNEPVVAPEVQKPIEHAAAMPAPAAPVAKPKPKPHRVAHQAAPAAVVTEAPREYQPPKPAPLPGVAGPIIGGIAGAVLGHQVGSGTGRTVATAVGAGAGILGGKVVEEKVRATKHWDVNLRLDDGSTKTISSDSEPAWHAGDRVRLVDGQLLKS
jgi:uncharacterized protein YcfJ